MKAIHYLKIDKEFETLLPQQSLNEHKELEKSLLEEGCRDALVVWGDTIIDGHNRYEICRRHKIEFDLIEKDFECREDALIWICQNQRGRRNITEEQKSYLIGREYEAEKVKQGTRNQYVQKNESHQADDFHPMGRTAANMAKNYNVGQSTIERSGDFAKGVDAIAEHSPAAKQIILSGESGATKTAIREVRKMEPEQVKEIALQIESGEYKEKKRQTVQRQQSPDMEQIAQKMDEMLHPQTMPTAEERINTVWEMLAINIAGFAGGITPYLDGTRSRDGLSETTIEKIIASAGKAIEAMISLKKIFERGTSE